MAEWSVPGYTALKELGAGGFGEVMLARHDATGTQVAIKYLRSNLLADREFTEMFRREAAVLASLDDPNIVRLYEYVESPSGAAIVMELVNGVSLREILERQGHTTPEAALVVLHGSLLGLAAAHQRRVVHRDYKPENVLVNGEGASKLTDFGLAARTGERPIPAGTLAYVAPEQIAGASATPASDVYSATATFYECLTGAPPFTGESAELLRQHHADPVPLESVPATLRPLVAAGMAKDPAHRPADAVTFVHRLQRVAPGAYGQDWAARGRSHLGEAALLLAALWPSVAAPATQGATMYRLPLLRHVSPVKAIIAAGVGAAVVAAGVVVAATLSRTRHTMSRTVAATPTAPAPRPTAGRPGRIIFLTTRASAHHPFWKIHQISPHGTGGRLLPIGNALCCSTPALSPDGTKLVFTGEGTMDVTDLNGHPANGLWSRSPGGMTTGTGTFLDPVWSPSGQQIAFIFSPGTGQSPEIDVINADGTGRRHVLRGSEISIQSGGALAWSPDGTQLAFATTPTVPPGSAAGIASGTIAVVAASGGPTHTLVIGIPDGAWGLSWAPGPQPLFTNGHEAGIWEANGHGGAKIVLQCGTCLDTYPSWAPDGIHFAAARHGKGVIVASVAGGAQATLGPRDVTYVQWGGSAGTSSPPTAPSSSPSSPRPAPSPSPSTPLPAPSPSPSGPGQSSPGVGPSSPASSSPLSKVSLVACPTNYGLERPPSRYPSKMALPIFPALAGRLAYYSDSTRSVQPIVAPRGWACSATVGADGTTTVTVFPPGGSSTGHEVVSAHDDSACVGCMYDTACPLVPHAGKDLGFSLLPCPARAPQETVTWLAGSPAAASAGTDMIRFMDPPGVKGDGTGSGGAFYARGLLLFSWGPTTSSNSPDRASTITCTLPAQDQSLCAAILTISQRQSWR